MVVEEEKDNIYKTAFESWKRVQVFVLLYV